MRIETFIQILMIIIAINCIHTRRSFFSVLLMSAISVLSAALYVLYQAPDVALAEIVIGSAFIPLIFIITILKVQDFKVIDATGDDYLSVQGKGYEILSRLCQTYDVKMTISNATSLPMSPSNIFRRGNADIIVTKDYQSNTYIIKGCVDSVMMIKLKRLLKDEEGVALVLVKDVMTDE